MKNLVIVGASQRCLYTYALNLTKDYGASVKFTGIYDVNRTRCEYFRDNIDKDIVVYSDFDVMLREAKPDTVLVTTVDKYHDDYIIRAFEAGCDVICEKPIATTLEKCRRIREAERKSGRTLTVTFNVRFMPYIAKIKELVKNGAIGKPLAFNYEYFLDLEHGADYFKRWHRFMENSGGMLVHKSTHHFDAATWIIDDEPVCVSAYGNRVYYGNGDKQLGERCHNCDGGSKCASYYDFAGDSFMRAFYFDAEEEDGYIRDSCAFSKGADIYDNMSATIAYKGGAILTYTLNMFSSYEGYTIRITGDKGRLEAKDVYSGIGKDSPDYSIGLFYNDGRNEEVTFSKPLGAHAGGDSRMLEMLFGRVCDDPLGQCAGCFDGIRSALVGICANESIKTGKRIDIKSILDGMEFV